MHCLCINFLLWFFSRSTILVRLDHRDYPELQYQPGDHLAALPVNSPELVDQLISKLHDAPDPDVSLKILSCKRETSGKTNILVDLYQKTMQCGTFICLV